MQTIPQSVSVLCVVLWLANSIVTLLTFPICTKTRHEDPSCISKDTGALVYVYGVFLVPLFIPVAVAIAQHILDQYTRATAQPRNQQRSFSAAVYHRAHDDDMDSDQVAFMYPTES